MDNIGISLGANRKKWTLGPDFCNLEGFFYMTTGKLPKIFALVVINVNCTVTRFKPN